MLMQPASISELWVVFLIDIYLSERLFFKYHPIRLIGITIETFESFFKPFMNKGKSFRYALGLILCLYVLSISLITTATILIFASKISHLCLFFASVLIGYSCISLRSLIDTASNILILTQKDIVAARSEIKALVGRDTEGLSKEDLFAAVIESVAENTNDGVVAPLFYFFLGGPILAVAYKVINTLDSMVGYKEGYLKEFGFFSAKLDDVVNYIPARISILMLILAGCFNLGSTKNSFKVALRDAKKHPSPNAGFLEAAMAGLLGVKLGGKRSYFGKQVDFPVFFNEGQSANITLAYRAIFVSFICSLNTLLLVTAIHKALT